MKEIDVNLYEPLYLLVNYHLKPRDMIVRIYRGSDYVRAFQDAKDWEFTGRHKSKLTQSPTKKEWKAIRGEYDTRE